MIGSLLGDDRLTPYGNFASSSNCKLTLHLALAGVGFLFRRVKVRTDVI